MTLVTQHPETGSAWSTGGRGGEQEDGDSPAPPELETRGLEATEKPLGRNLTQECGLTLCRTHAARGPEPQVNPRGSIPKGSVLFKEEQNLRWGS